MSGLDRVTRQQLTEALESAESATTTSCGFFACPGPDKPVEWMATCSVCRTTQLLRRACARLGLLNPECACCRMFPRCHGSWACQDCGHQREAAA